MPESSQSAEEQKSGSEGGEPIRPPVITGMGPVAKMIALASIVILLVAVPLGYLLMTQDDDADEEEEDGVVVLTIAMGTTSVDFTMEELHDMDSVTESGTLIKSTGTVVGPNEYTGVPLASLVDVVYSGVEYGLEVESTDGYTMTYNVSQVEDGLFEHYTSEGVSLGFGEFTMIVAYAQDGSPLVDMDLRIAIVDESVPITDGHFWAKYARTLYVVPLVKEWTIELNGITSMEIDRQTFESIASCPYHAVNYTFENDTGTHVYTGVALWTVVSAVDGADGLYDEYMFNDLQAFAGYNVNVSADDYYYGFDSMQVARNDSIIIANELDGEPLEDEEWPLKIVGNWLSGKAKVKAIASISLEDIVPAGDWRLALNGTKKVNMSAATFVSAYYSGLHGPWFNYTDPSGASYGGVHATYYNYTSDLVDHTYAGIPLWMLVAAVDGEDVDHYEFNESLADTEYSVTISALDGFSTTLPISTVEKNNSIIVAFMLDWEALVYDPPLRLVGPYLSGSQKVSGIVSVELIDLPT